MADAFAEMAFLDAAPAGSALEPPATSHVISVGFTHPLQGRITLYLPLACKRGFVQNVYGRRWEELRAAEIDDCLLELGNVLAGGFLASYCGSGAPRSVTLPSLHFDDTEIPCEGESVTESFEAEGLPFRVTVCLPALP